MLLDAVVLIVTCSSVVAFEVVALAVVAGDFAGVVILRSRGGRRRRSRKTAGQREQGWWEGTELC